MSIFNFNKYIAYILFALVILIHLVLIIANICSIRAPDTYTVSHTANIVSWILSLVFVLLVIGWQYNEKYTLEKQNSLTNTSIPTSSISYNKNPDKGNFKRKSKYSEYSIRDNNTYKQGEDVDNIDTNTTYI